MNTLIQRNETPENIILGALESFGVTAHHVETVDGPALTRYIYRVGPGSRQKFLTNLGSEVAAALGVRTATVATPLEGKAGCVAIDVAKNEKTPVKLSEVLRDADLSGKLAFVVGKTVEGQTLTYDLTRAPHMMIAGATGSGKSVFLHQMLSLLMNRPCTEFVLIDMKQTELMRYRGRANVFAPSRAGGIVTSPSDAVTALHSLQINMQLRYRLFALAGVTSLDEYNAIGDELRERASAALKAELGHIYALDTSATHLPRVVLVIDELANLMLGPEGKRAEAYLGDIAALSRAAGIHMVLATQHPLSKVISSTLKANIPTKAAFMVSNAAASRVILDKAGAEKLAGAGDMLFTAPGVIDPIRCQSPILD